MAWRGLLGTVLTFVGQDVFYLSECVGRGLKEVLDFVPIYLGRFAKIVVRCLCGVPGLEVAALHKLFAEGV